MLKIIQNLGVEAGACVLAEEILDAIEKAGMLPPSAGTVYVQKDHNALDAVQRYINSRRWEPEDEEDLK